LLGVPLYLVAGSSLLAVRMVSIILSAVAALLVWRVGRRTIGEPAGAVAGALFWIWPPFNFPHLTVEYGFYGSNIVYCALLMLLALRVVERPDRIRVAMFGLVFGLAFWQTAQIIPIAVGVIAWTIWKKPRCLRHLPVAIPLAAVGALPWILWNFTHDWGSVMVRARATEYAHSLRLLASPLLPMTLGLRAPLSAELILPKPAMYVVYVSLLVLFVYGAFKMRNRNSSILYFVAAVFPFVWALSRRVSSMTSDPVYLIVVTPVLALLAAQVATRYVRAAALLVVVCLVSSVTLHRMNIWLHNAAPRWPPAVPRDLSPLISTLDRLGLDHVYAYYWIAYRLDFDTRERIIAVEDQFTLATFCDRQLTPLPSPFVRYPPYQREVRVALHGFVFFRAGTRSIPIVKRLERRGYRRYFVGPFVVYAPPAAKQPLTPCSPKLN
jgi:4-amino-4-deoxy-L-arabinose transferase-like glycosyltransferase